MRLRAEHDEVVTGIRQHAGFTRFLQTPRLSDLRQAAAGDTVILVNAGMLRSDAIIITASAPPLQVELPQLANWDVHSRATELRDATHDMSRLVGHMRKPRVVQETLDWLWDTVVGPILAAHPPVAGGEGQLPRVWWLATGLLGLFPLHAAGHAGQPGALDAIVSSYTPTLRALAHARARQAATSRRQLAVAIEHTPGYPDLHGTVAEATALYADHPDSPLLTSEHATTHRLLTELPASTWAHFACHATSSSIAPSQAGLRLQDGVLSVPDISRLNLVEAELAYLSACSTAHSGWYVADESTSLDSAFHLAGFRHVISSLWPLSDRIAAIAARSFYQHLPDTPDADQAAATLHRVVRELRAEHPERPDLWAPLVHSGP